MPVVAAPPADLRCPGRATSISNGTTVTGPPSGGNGPSTPPASMRTTMLTAPYPTAGRVRLTEIRAYSAMVGAMRATP